MPFGSEGVRYIKIAKIDKDGIDQTNSLQSLTKLIIPYSSGEHIRTYILFSSHNFLHQPWLNQRMGLL